MKTEITTAPPLNTPAITQEQADRGTARLKHLLPSLRECPAARTEAQRILPVLSAPARPEWVMARVLSLLNPYFEKDAPQAVREMEAEDWADALADAPQWAITAAVRWWKGADNPKRARRPVEGDIQDRIRIEMRAVRAARIALQSPEPRAAQEAEPRQPATKEQRSAIIAEIGMTRERIAEAGARAMPGCDFQASKAARAGGQG